MRKAVLAPDYMQLQLRVTPDVHDRLRKFAFDERRSLASAARVLIEDGLRERRVIVKSKTGVAPLTQKKANVSPSP